VPSEFVSVVREHKFKIGERLFVVRREPEGAYIVIRRLPKREGEFEYQIKSVDDLNKRVVRESQLRAHFPPGKRALLKFV
jgi:hypothetical protein